MLCDLYASLAVCLAAIPFGRAAVAGAFFTRINDENLKSSNGAVDFKKTKKKEEDGKINKLWQRCNGTDCIKRDRQYKWNRSVRLC